MHDRIGVWFVGCLAVAATIASEVLNAAIAFGVSRNIELLLGLRILLFVGFGLGLVAVASLIYFTVLYVPNVALQRLGVRHTIWIIYSVGLGVSVATLIVPGVLLVWLVLQQDHLHESFLGSRPMAWIAAWFSGWGASLLLQIALFTMLGVWTRKELKVQSVGRLDLDFGIRMPPMDEVGVNGSRRSLNSRENAITSPPRTSHSSQAASSVRYSSSTKGTAANSRTKLVGKPSPRSSLDAPVLPTVDTLTADAALDSWDVPTTHRDTAPAPGPLLPLSRAGLEPIPGSRPDSATSVYSNQVLDVIHSSPPQALSADTAMVLDQASSPRTYHSQSTTSPQSQTNSTIPSSPPSSPPNFSRPTSRQRNDKQFSTSSTKNSFSTSPLSELIHPLFRTTSPHPPPIAITGSMVTASPMANNPITPKTLARLRTNLSTDRARSRSPPSVPKISAQAIEQVAAIKSQKNGKETANDVISSSPTIPAPKFVEPQLRSQGVDRQHSYNDSATHIQQTPTPAPRPTSSSVVVNTRRQPSSSLGHWRAMPSISNESGSQSQTRPSTAGSTALGSPGPSIIDDEELPPILPGFVLGAGQRTSLMGYKERTSKRGVRTTGRGDSRDDSDGYMMGAKDERQSKRRGSSVLSFRRD